MEIKFKAGEFIRFRTVRPVTVGAIDAQIPAGAEIGFDGVSLDWNGQKASAPALRAAIKSGWFEPLQEVTYETTKVAAPVPSAAARRVVVADDESYVGPATANPKAARPNLTVTPARSSETDGEVIGRVKTAATQKFNLNSPTAVAEAMRELEKQVKTTRFAVVEGGSGPLGEEVQAVPDRKAAAVAEAARRREQRLRAAGVSTPDSEAQAAPEPVAVQAAPAVEVAEPQGAPNLINAAQALSPGFTWDLKAHWSSRVKTALSRKDDPNFLSAVLMVESDTVRRKIVEGLAAKE